MYIYIIDMRSCISYTHTCQVKVLVEGVMRRAWNVFSA